MKVVFGYGVWGASYAKRFLEWALPSQVTQGNLLTFDPDSRIVITTDAEGREVFEKSDLIRILRTKFDVLLEVREPSFYDRDNKYEILNDIQNDLITLSNDFEAIGFGYADAIWSEGSYAYAVEQLESGFDIACTLGLNVAEDRFIEEISAKYGRKHPSGLPIPSSYFSDLVIKHLHPIARMNLATSSCMNSYPSYIIWEDKNVNHLVARAFHQHPILIRVGCHPNYFSGFKGSIDENFIRNITGQRTKVSCNPSSRNAFVCGLRSDNEIELSALENPKPFNLESILIFAEQSAAACHRQFFEKPIIIGEVNPSIESNQLSNASTLFYLELAAKLARPDSEIKRLNSCLHEARSLMKNEIRSEKIWYLLKKPNQYMQSFGPKYLRNSSHIRKRQNFPYQFISIVAFPYLYIVHRANKIGKISTQNKPKDVKRALILWAYRRILKITSYIGMQKSTELFLTRHWRIIANRRGLQRPYLLPKLHEKDGDNSSYYDKHPIDEICVEIGFIEFIFLVPIQIFLSIKGRIVVAERAE